MGVLERLVWNTCNLELFYDYAATEFAFFLDQHCCNLLNTIHYQCTGVLLLLIGLKVKDF